MLSSWRHSPDGDSATTPPRRHLWLHTMNITSAATNIKQQKPMELSKRQKKNTKHNSAVTNLQSPAKSSCFILQRETKIWNIKCFAPHRSGHLCPSGSVNHSGKDAWWGTWHLYFPLQALPHFPCWALGQILWKELSVSHLFCSAPGVSCSPGLTLDL